jgi:diguanylate cyclase (GGDEF)-like protein
MSTQPILLVIGIAIAVNLVIMGGLVVTLIARRRGRFAPAEGPVEPSPYRYRAMETTPPTATSPISFIDEEPEDEYDRSEEGFEEDVSATEPADYRRFRPVMSDEGERVETTIASFLTPPPAPAPTPAPAAPEAPAPAPAAPEAPPPAPAQAPRPIAHLTPRPSGPAADGTLDWEVRVRDEEARLARYRRPVSVVLVELDGLGRLAERLGPDAAERIVPPVGQTLVRQARAADHVARIGTSRFAILLPETDEIQAINYVERVRADCDRWLAAGAVSMRLAIGWACPTPGGDLRTATRLAEDRLNADRRHEFPRAEMDLEPVATRGPRPYTAGPIEANAPGAVELTPPDGAE